MAAHRGEFAEVEEEEGEDVAVVRLVEVEAETLRQEGDFQWKTQRVRDAFAGEFRWVVSQVGFGWVVSQVGFGWVV